jgi:hypothetical protein
MEVEQYLHRLDDINLCERLNALQELRFFSRNDSKLVGEQAIGAIFNFLSEHETSEEYQECLDLLTRLISDRDKSISEKNAKLILSSGRNIELLLDLLEHKDSSVAIMSNQLLTELHVVDRVELETLIQSYPSGFP